MSPPFLANQSVIPGNLPRVDTGNPLTSGLTFCWVGSHQKINVIAQNTGAISNCSQRLGPYGLASQSGAGGSGITFTAAGIPSATDFTFAVIAKPASTAGGANADSMFCMRNAANLIMSFRANYDGVGNARADGKLGFIAFNGAVFGATSVASVCDGAWHALLAVRRGSNFFLYADGKDVTATTAASSASFYNANQNTAVGREAIDTSAPAQFPMSMACGWTRALSIPEISKWSFDPFSLLTRNISRTGVNGLVGITPVGAGFFSRYYYDMSRAA